MAEGAMGYLWDLFYKLGNPTTRGFPSWRDCETTHLLIPPPRSNTDAVWPSSAVPRCKRIKNKKLTSTQECAHVFITATFTVTNQRKQCKWPSSDEWIRYRESTQWELLNHNREWKTLYTMLLWGVFLFFEIFLFKYLKNI